MPSQSRIPWPLSSRSNRWLAGSRTWTVEARRQRLAHRRVGVIESDDLNLVGELLQALDPTGAVVMVDPDDAEAQPGHRDCWGGSLDTGGSGTSGGGLAPADAASVARP